MKQALLSIGVALALSAALPTLADAQGRGGHGGGGISAGGGGGGGFARSAPPGGFARSPASSGFARSAPSGAFAAPSGGQRFVQGTQGGQRFVQGGANLRGVRHGRRFFRGGPGFAFYGAPYYDYAYASECYQLRLIGGVWQRVWVCDYDYDY